MSLLAVHFMKQNLHIGTLFGQERKPVIVFETGSVKVKMPAGYICTGAISSSTSPLLWQPVE